MKANGFGTMLFLPSALNVKEKFNYAQVNGGSNLTFLLLLP